MAKLKAACECVVIDKVWLIRDVHASTISLGVLQGTQLCNLHIMNLKSCSVSRPLCVKTARVYEEKSVFTNSWIYMKCSTNGNNN